MLKAQARRVVIVTTLLMMMDNNRYLELPSEVDKKNSKAGKFSNSSLAIYNPTYWQESDSHDFLFLLKYMCAVRVLVFQQYGAKCGYP